MKSVTLRDWSQCLMANNVSLDAKTLALFVKRRPVITPKVRTLQYGADGDVAHCNYDVIAVVALAADHEKEQRHHAKLFHGRK